MNDRLSIGPGDAPGPPLTLDSHEQLIDIAPDGRFIVAQRPDLGTLSSLALIVNWFADLEARLAANGA